MDVRHAPKKSEYLHSFHQIESDSMPKPVRVVIKRRQKMEHNRKENRRPFGRRNAHEFDARRDRVTEFDRKDREVIFFGQALEHSQMATAHGAIGPNRIVKNRDSRFAQGCWRAHIFCRSTDTGPREEPRETGATASFSITGLPTIGRAA